MERDAIYVRNVGIIEARVNHEVGVARDKDCKYYILDDTHVPGRKRWVPENEFWTQHVTPEKGGISVTYGVRSDDPLKELIHEFDFREGEIHQYQVSNDTGYIELVKVANKKRFDPLVTEGMRRGRKKTRVTRVWK